MRKALSVKAIEAFKPKVKRYEVHDLLCPGFSLRVFPTGRKVFTVKYRYGLKQRRLPIGVHPRISLVQARDKALEALRLVDEGIDPAARRRQLGMNVEAIAASILSVPPIGEGKATSPFLAGFSSDRMGNPGSGAQFAFARRIGQIYIDLTGKMPGVTKERPGPYQRMTEMVAGVFRQAYKSSGSQFGEWKAPSRDDMQKACKSIGRKST